MEKYEASKQKRMLENMALDDFAEEFRGDDVTETDIEVFCEEYTGTILSSYKAEKLWFDIAWHLDYDISNNVYLKNTHWTDMVSNVSCQFVRDIISQRLKSVYMGG